MASFGAVSLVSLLGFSSAFAQSTDSQEPTSRTAFDGAKSGAWLFPVESLNRDLPRLLQIGGEYRSRIEGADDIKYSTTDDVYLLSRFGFNATIQPANWLTFFGETQDSRIFFNHHVPDVPYQNTWDIRQAYVQLGSSTEGWPDLIVGRQVLAFGVERVIGPSDWLNAVRTFDAVRFDVHHAGDKVSLFTSSVVIGVDGAMDHHLQGNNLYGVYGSFKNAVPKATLEPYVLWRLTDWVTHAQGRACEELQCTGIDFRQSAEKGAIHLSNRSSRRSEAGAESGGPNNGRGATVLRLQSESNEAQQSNSGR
jgi:hypothetical protein